MGKIPAFQFYPGDWLKDPGVRACSLHARGLWFDILCYMHQSPKYGYFLAGGQPPTDEEGARILGCTVQEYQTCLAELERFSVFSRTKNGTIFSRRMIRDEAQRKAWRNRQTKHRDIRRDAGVTKCDMPVSKPSPSQKFSADSIPINNTKEVINKRQPNKTIDCLNSVTSRNCHGDVTAMSRLSSSSSSIREGIKGGSSSIGESNKSEIESKKSEPTPLQEKTSEEIISIANKLYTQQIFPKVVVFINTAKKEGKSLSAIKHALFKCLNDKPRPPDSWAFCQKIVNEDNQKFKHQDNNSMWLGLVEKLKQISEKQE